MIDFMLSTFDHNENKVEKETGSWLPFTTLSKITVSPQIQAEDVMLTFWGNLNKRNSGPEDVTQLRAGGLTGQASSPASPSLFDLFPHFHG